MEIKETFTSLQEEVDLKTKKLSKVNKHSRQPRNTITVWGAHRHVHSFVC